MNRHYSLIAIAGLIAVTQAHATISFDLEAEVLRDQNGAALPANSLVWLVASTLDANFSNLQGSITNAVGQTTSPGGDDYIVFKGSVNNGTGELLANPTNLVLAANGGSIPNWDTGDPLALIWFSGATASTPSLLGGERYGIYTRATAADGSSIWSTPNNNVSNYKLYFFTSDAVDLNTGGTNTPTSARSSSTVAAAAPEPTSAGLLAMGAVSLMIRRRRGRA
jgi:hypothetical protein